MDESDDEKLLNNDVNVDGENQSESENDDDLEEERALKLYQKLK